MSTAEQALRLVNKLWDYFVGERTREELTLDQQISYWADQANVALSAHDGNAYSAALDRLQFYTDARDSERRSNMHPVHSEEGRASSDQGNRANVSE